MRGKMNKIATKLMTSSALACVLALPAAAQTTPDDSRGIEQVTVTSTKGGATQIQTTPMAISAFSTDKLDQGVVNNVKDLSNLVPDLNMSQTTTFAEIYIRGVGSNNTGNGSDPDVTVQVDGVYLARPFTQFADFLDVDRVEVLRGPQGTLYGRNAVGGTVNVVSRLPSDTFTAEEQLTLGDYGAVENQSYISGPIAKNINFSLALNYARHDDYQQNIGGGNNVFGQNEGGARGQLRYDISNELNATTRLDFSIASFDLENFDEIMTPLPASLVAQGANNNTIFGNYSKVSLNSPQYANVTSFGVSEEVNYDFDDHLSLKSISAYRRAMNKGHVDSDYTNLNMASVFQGEDEWEATQELNLIGHYDDLDFVGGFFYYHEHDQSSTTISRPAANLLIGAPPLTVTDSEALFAQGTYHLTDQWSLTLGARYTLEQKSLDQDYNYTFLSTGQPTGTPPGLFSMSNNYYAFTPKAGINWQATADLLFYFSATKGYKSGGYNYVASTPAAAAFAPEKLTSYELGAKSDWFDDRLRVNLTGFIYDYDNLQVNQLISPGVVSISNAANAEIKGLELELVARPISGLELTANLSRLDARYSNYPNAPLAAALGTGTINATGNYLDAAPPYSAFVSAQYDIPVDGGSTFVRGEFSWQDRVFYDPSNYLSQSQGAYGLLNFFVGYNWLDEKMEFEGFVKNATDKSYIFGAAANGLVPTGEAGAPRTFGFRITKSW
jgi:iron complex outermembrane receptor protein